MPGEAFFIKLDYGLGHSQVGHARRDEVGLVRPNPLDEKHELAGGVGGADDPFGFQAPRESPGFLANLYGFD